MCRLNGYLLCLGILPTLSTPKYPTADESFMAALSRRFFLALTFCEFRLDVIDMRVRLKVSTGPGSWGQVGQVSRVF